MSMNTVPERLAALREAMKANGVDVYLIPVGDPHASEYMPDHYTALTYFSGFHGENSNFVVTMTESAVWADGRYFVQAEKEIAARGRQAGPLRPDRLLRSGAQPAERAGRQERHHQAAEPRGRAVDGGPSRPARHPGMAPAEGVRRLLPCREAGPAACEAL